VLPFYTQSWLRLPATTFQLLALTVQTTALCLMPFWGWVSVKTGKKLVYFVGMSFWVLAQAGLVFLKPGDTKIIFLMAFVAGFGISVCYLIPNAMLPDVVEYDELKTGRRREGVYFGFCIFLQKTALAIGTFIVGQSLAVAGYIPSGRMKLIPGAAWKALLAIRPGYRAAARAGSLSVSDPDRLLSHHQESTRRRSRSRRPEASDLLMISKPT
jgi:GPH family glycoside/pentoside/hexuronide:cation symporter